jgi:glucose-6-phosphate dehydrogenase assembly protein OpcA
VVTWWHLPPPERVAHDPLGVVADRRITDVAQSSDPIEALRNRADDYAPGDTDMAWTRSTSWRTLIAGAFDAYRPAVRSITLTAPDNDPSAALMAGWLTARLGVQPTWEAAPKLSGARFTLADGDVVEITSNNDGTVLLRRSNLPDRTLTLVGRPLGEDLAEELKRLDPDQPYAAALAAATGRGGLDDRNPTRVHVWHDPAVAERPDAVYAS